MTQQSLVLVGGGGHCLSCVDVIEAAGILTIVGIVDNGKDSGETVLKYPVLGGDDALPTVLKEHPFALVTVGQLKDASLRRDLFERLISLGAQVPVVVAPSAAVSRHVTLGQGTILMHQTVVNAGAQVGDNCIVNTAAVIEHEVVIDDHCHISTGSIINGECRIGTGSFVGSRSVLKEGVALCPGTILGAGTVVVKDIQEPGVYVGNPARKVV